MKVGGEVAENVLNTETRRTEDVDLKKPALEPVSDVGHDKTTDEFADAEESHRSRRV